MHETKKKIMDTAIGLIKEKGYTKVSVDEICKKCGMTRGAFYHHYKSKDDMLENYYNLFNEVNADNILKVVEFSTPETQLWALLEMYIDNTISLGPDLLKRLFIISIEHQSSIFSAFSVYSDTTWSKVAISIIRKGQEQGAFRAGMEPCDLLWLYVDCLNFIAIDWSGRGGVYDEKAELRHLFDVLFLQKNGRTGTESERIIARSSP